MKGQVLTIGVQNAYDAGRSTQVFFVLTQLSKRISAGFKQQIEHRFAIAHRKASQLLRQRENDVEIGGRQQFAHPVL
jgi:hypothetical protein